MKSKKHIETLKHGVAAQIAASNPKSSVWVSANAGTGKTRVLVDRISRLLLMGTPASKILCLTFTKAAAGEMALRLNERLGKWAATKKELLRDQLSVLLARPPSNDELDYAQQLFASTIDSPDGLRIRTIHSFCESLLGRFPLESGLPPHFTVIDERRSAELREQARDQVLAQSNTDTGSHLNRALNHLAGLVNEDGFANVMTELDAGRHKLAAMLSAYDSKNTDNALKILITLGRELLGLAEKDTEKTIITDACRDETVDISGLNSAADILRSGTKTDMERGEKLSAWLSDNEKSRAFTLLEKYFPIFLTQRNQPRSARGLMTQTLARVHPQALDLLLIEQSRIFAVTQKLKSSQVAENTQALLTVGATLLGAYGRLKSERAMVDYDDLIFHAAALLGTLEDVSWVHFKLDGGIDHILVDEAQDTSPTQWSIIRALAGDFFSGVGRKVQYPRTIFAVGDEKQSIYSFQGADPERFGTTGSQMERHARKAKQGWNTIKLGLSWRSTPAILKAVDGVFSRSAASDGLSWGGRPIRHQWSRNDAAGLVELWKPTEPIAFDNDDPWDAPLDQIPVESPQVRLATQIAEKIDGWLANEEVLESQGRRIEPGDILILVRSRATFAEEMVKALKDRRIPVAGRDRIDLDDHLAIMDLIAVAKFTLLPEDDLNTATVLKGPFIEMDEENLFRLAHLRDTGLWGSLQNQTKDSAVYQSAHDRLSILLSRADRMQPFEFFSVLLSDGGRESLLAHLGPEADDPINEFLGLALDFERDHVPSLEAFVYWVGHGGTEVKRDLEQSGGKVRVMTTHGAKGLQARIVFLADTCTLPARQLANKILWYDAPKDKATHTTNLGTIFWPAFKDNEGDLLQQLAVAERKRKEQEYRRLLYVAMTRAEDRLYIAGWKGEYDLDEGCWYRLVEEGLKTLSETQHVDDGTLDPVVLRLTSSQKVEAKANDQTSYKNIKPVSLPNWANSPPSAEPTPSRPLSPSRQETGPTVHSPIGPDETRRFQRGKLIHSLLQILPDLPQKSRATAAERYLALSAHQLSSMEQTQILTETLSVLETPGFAPLFGPGSRAEVPIIGRISPSGGIDAQVVSGQVDRLLIAETEILLVDFKTNRPPPSIETDVAHIYLRQMASYRVLLQQVFPEKPVKAALLWTDSLILMPLTATLLDKHAP
ncbi:MAG: double-strand break repair helicase AddA [Rhodospirillaceae bacterium TMED8]|nr:double-strand break repair helicase AddA [Magnetovibrio sp.]OUT51157.1 MAG: double-strand break repair helicase AddA [Rhodospirillaceae bacterium TMED8]